MARLSVSINGDNRTFALTERSIQIGRALDNDIVLNHVIVSRRHAQIALRGRQAWVTDLGSRNGISVNRLRVKEEQLHDGDTLQIGPFEIRFEDRAAQSPLRAVADRASVHVPPEGCGHSLNRRGCQTLRVRASSLRPSLVRAPARPDATPTYPATLAPGR